jgi:23S rRNA (cytidine1920-2'-O)/16S rRNA (cytidine1409-2'-O)-methyltransferase
MSGRSRIRADLAMVSRGLADSRARARALIEAAEVYAGSEQITRPSQLIATQADLRIKGDAHQWVSRGAPKLAHALSVFEIDLMDRVGLDIGASTGGFTEMLLEHGCRRVYAVDVGHDQLHPRLRGDPRVLSLEGLNARDLSAREIPEPVDIVTADVSFISLTKALPGPMRLAAPGADLVALVKPQFEVGREGIGKKGVVKVPALHKKACEDISGWLEGQPGWRVLGLEESPIIGRQGNREFLIAARLEG